MTCRPLEKGIIRCSGHRRKKEPPCPPTRDTGRKDGNQLAVAFVRRVLSGLHNACVCSRRHPPRQVRFPPRRAKSPLTLCPHALKKEAGRPQSPRLHVNADATESHAKRNGSACRMAARTSPARSASGLSHCLDRPWVRNRHSPGPAGLTLWSPPTSSRTSSTPERLTAQLNSPDEWA